jgi:ribosomal protein S18 acetylase RimI-like enzyme
VTIEIRSVSGYADLERWVAARNEVWPDDPDSAEMMALVRASELEHVDLLAYEQGEVVGTGMLAADPTSLESSHPYVEVTVRARHRGRGAGSALLRDLSERVRRLGKDGLQCEARAHDANSVAFLERRGFVECGRSAMYVLELGHHDAVEPAPPDGIELALLSDRPELLHGMYAVAKVTYPEVGGYQARQADAFHDWQLYQLGSPRLALDMTPIALAGGEVIGFATLIRGLDGRSAEHRMAAVLPEWRRRGIATTLLRAQLAAAKRASVDTVIAWGRSDHVGQVYGTRLGFEPRTETIGFRGPLQLGSAHYRQGTDVISAGTDRTSIP